MLFFPYAPCTHEPVVLIENELLTHTHTYKHVCMYVCMCVCVCVLGGGLRQRVGIVCVRFELSPHPSPQEMIERRTYTVWKKTLPSRTCYVQ